MRIYLANIGANSSHRQIVSPLFPDGTFELLPIPEGDRTLDDSPHAVHYRDLRSYYNSGDGLLHYVHKDFRNTACHNDPDFTTFTYGDNGTNGRSSALAQLSGGDVLLFLARLEKFVEGNRTQKSGFYLVGGLRVDHANFITPNSVGRERFVNNAHVVRGDGQFLGVAGSRQSRRFERAIPITRGICDAVFRDKDGSPRTWGDGKTDLARIGSYTRTCRCVLDTADHEQDQRAGTLRAWIAEYSNARDAELLSTDQDDANTGTTLYSYIVANDGGFAPNPFHGFCTLACCKPRIRKYAQQGDYVVGIGPKRLGNHVVYAMRVTEVMDFDDYWHDERFRIKQPDQGAGGQMAVGDNIYYRDKSGRWLQEPSAHSHDDGTQDWGNTFKDTNGEKVLISSDFIYWGGDGPQVPGNLRDITPRVQGHRSRINDSFVPDFIEWFESHRERGLLGPPTQALPPISRQRTPRS